MMRAIGETNRRRAIQQAYNEEHGIAPQTVRNAVREVMEITRKHLRETAPVARVNEEERERPSTSWRSAMIAAAKQPRL